MKLAFQKYGSLGAPVIVLHGLLGSRQNWDSFCRKLSEEFQVFALDQRNHGESPHALGMTYKELARDVEEFVDDMGLNAVHAIGHSMGGKTVMCLALEHARKVRSLVVVDIGPQKYPPWHRSLLDAMLALNLGAYSQRQEMEDELASAIPDLATRRFLLKNVRRDTCGLFYWKIGLVEINAGYRDLMEGLIGTPHSGPALFLKGEKSDYLAASDVPKIRELFPSADFKIIPRAGHWVQVENPQELEKVVTQFLRLSSRK